jgi:hypothetical protein
MVKNGINAEDLHEETLVKLGAPMPPRPETAGMASAERMRSLGHYYDANKDAILADFNELGEPAMLKKWGISPQGWAVRRARWMPERFAPPERKSRAGRPPKAPKVARAAEASGKPAKEGADKGGNYESLQDLTKAPLPVQVAYYQGWHDASIAFLRAGRG